MSFFAKRTNAPKFGRFCILRLISRGLFFGFFKRLHLGCLLAWCSGACFYRSLPFPRLLFCHEAFFLSLSESSLNALTVLLQFSAPGRVRGNFRFSAVALYLYFFSLSVFCLFSSAWLLVYGS
jgi:hypothetical protein